MISYCAVQNSVDGGNRASMSTVVFSAICTVVSAIYDSFVLQGDTQHNWLRHCATSRKVSGSIPNGVIAIFP